MGYGRRNLATFPGEVKNYVLYQVGALAAFCRANRVALRHLKPHGALYNLAAGDEKTAREVIEAVLAYDPGMILVALSGSRLAELAEAAGLNVAREVFPDRAYLADGRLAPRSLPGAVIHEVEPGPGAGDPAVHPGDHDQHRRPGDPLRADTLCIHGDTPGAWKLAKTIGEA